MNNSHHLESRIAKLEMKGWPYMVSLEQQTTTGHDVPRFDDGMINIRELIRIMAESLVNK